MLGLSWDADVPWPIMLGLSLWPDDQQEAWGPRYARFIVIGVCSVGWVCPVYRYGASSGPPAGRWGLEDDGPGCVRLIGSIKYVRFIGTRGSAAMRRGAAAGVAAG
jgi:hypothetical protein